MPAPDDPIAALRAAWAAGDYAAILALAAVRPALADDDEAAFRIALAHIHTGALPAAEPILRQVLDRRPGFAEARAALCKLYLVQGRTAEAQAVLDLLRAQADADPRAGLAFGEALMQARRVGEAQAAFAAFARATGDPAALVPLAETALRMGRIDEGAAHARQAAAAFGLTPRVLSVLGPAMLCIGDAVERATCLGALQRLPASAAAAQLQSWTDILVAADRLREAAEACERLAELAPSAPRLRFLADLRLSNQDLAGALESAEAARALAPDDAAAIAMLARCNIVAGKLDAAADLALAAIAADPAQVAGYDYLTQIGADRLDQAQRAQLEALRTAPPRAPDDRARAALSLGRVAEAERRYAEAFDLYAEAKADIARRFAEAGRGYKPAEIEANVRAFAAAFPRPVTCAHADARAPRPIFIVGMPRSGTTLLEQILGGHPEIAAAGELPGMMRIAADFLPLAAGGNAEAALNASGAAWAARYRADLPATTQGVTAFTDKHPLNFWSIGLIKALFPQARIVHVSRNPTDTALSIFKERFYAGYSFANDLDALAHYYAAYERLMAHWRAGFGQEIFEARYEEFVTDAEGRARALIAFCGLGWDSACLDFHQSRRAVFTHSAAQVRKPVSADSVARSARFGDKLRPFDEALARYRAP